MVNFHFWVWAVSYLRTGDRPDVAHSHPGTRGKTVILPWESLFRVEPTEGEVHVLALC